MSGEDRNIVGSFIGSFFEGMYLQGSWKKMPFNYQKALTDNYDQLRIIERGIKNDVALQEYVSGCLESVVQKMRGAKRVFEATSKYLPGSHIPDTEDLEKRIKEYEN